VKIEEETIYIILNCNDCCKTFSGDHAQWDADMHATMLNHTVAGEIRKAITFARAEPDRYKGMGPCGHFNCDGDHV